MRLIKTLLAALSSLCRPDFKCLIWTKARQTLVTTEPGVTPGHVSLVTTETLRII